jgi:DNA-binding response OmpR family regulator
MCSDKLTVLLTEDSAILAFALTDELEIAGFVVAGPFARSRDAEAWLGAATPDCAVLDVRLLDGDCTELAKELIRRQVPVVVLSGFQRATCPVQIAATEWLEKPAWPGDLPTALHRVVGRAQKSIGSAHAGPTA